MVVKVGLAIVVPLNEIFQGLVEALCFIKVPALLEGNDGLGAGLPQGADNIFGELGLVRKDGAEAEKPLRLL